MTEQPGVPQPPEAEGGWHRVHPLTPLIRSWQALALGVAFLAQDGVQRLARGEVGSDDLQVGRTALLIVVAVVVGVLLLAAGVAFLSWRMTRYRVTAEALEIRSGIISRQQRRARLDRLQAVDLVQPLAARVTGLARLSLDVAGGKDSKLTLAYLSHSQAMALRNRLLASAAGVRYETEQAPHAPEREVLQLAPGRLLASLALSGTAFGLVVVAGLAVVGGVVVGELQFALAVVPAALSLGSWAWTQFASGFGFRLAVSPDGLRLRRGLLEQRTQTVPPGRVQAVGLTQPLLWRIPDWWRIQVNVAGYAGDSGRSRATDTLLLPVGTRDQALTVLAHVVGDLGLPEPSRPGELVAAALSGSGPEHGFQGAPPSARWLDPFAWRRRGYLIAGSASLVRSGFWSRRLIVVPHARVQSCGVRQGPVQRALGLASLALHSTSGPVRPLIGHLATGAVPALLAAQVDAARRARRTAGPERWMERSDPADAGAAERPGPEGLSADAG